MFPIVRRKEMAGGAIILNEISAPKIARVAQPGQFVILMAGEKSERIPMTISDIDPVKETITIIYHVVGRSTAAFKRLQVGDGYKSVAGPLGRPWCCAPSVSCFQGLTNSFTPPAISCPSIL